MMDEARFWNVIEQAGACGGDDQPEALQSALEELDPKDILGFDEVFAKLMRRAHTWDLWAAAYIIEGGCSDDGFEYFRAGLIGLGRQTYEDAVRDPETLARLPARGINFSNEELMYAASSAYEAVTGEEMPLENAPYDTSRSTGEPTGKRWDEDTVNEKYPALAEKFGGA